MVIGLTGQIGAGKSTAATILKRFGANVVGADEIGRQVVDKSERLKDRLARAFGSDILTPTGKLRRKLLAERAFADATGRQELNRLVHPHLLKELKKQVKRAVRVHRVVVVDAALLLFWNLDKEVDRVLVIHASKQERFRRMAARGISASDAAARQAAQLPFSEFRSRADRLILNNGSQAQLETKLRAFWRQTTGVRPAAR